MGEPGHVVAPPRSVALDIAALMWVPGHEAFTLTPADVRWSTLTGSVGSGSDESVIKLSPAHSIRSETMVVLVALASAASTLVGGLFAVRVRDHLHLILGLAAGVMLGVVVFDLVPEAITEAGTDVFGVPAALLLLLVGFLTIHIVERSTAMHSAHEDEFGQHHHAMPIVGGIAGSALVVHSLLDGVGIALGFQASKSIGVIVAIAVIAHDFADGFNTYTLVSLYGNARSRALILLALDALAPVVGVTIGSALSLSTHVVGLYLGYFAGFLLYLATEDILPEAHANHPSRLTLVCTVVGAGFMWLVVGLSH